MNVWRPMAMLAGMMLLLMLPGSAAEGRPRIAFLALSGPQQSAQLIAAFLDGLRRLSSTAMPRATSNNSNRWRRN